MAVSRVSGSERLVHRNYLSRTVSSIARSADFFAGSNNFPALEFNAMAVTKKTIITVETWRRTVLSRQQISTLRCELCAAEVVMLSITQAAQISDTDEPTIIRRIERGELHFIKTTDNNLLICSQSLSTKNCD